MMQAELSSTVFARLSETLRTEIMGQIERVNDAVYTITANSLGVTVDHIRMLDQSIISVALIDQNLLQSLDNLSATETKILDDIKATLQMYNNAPLSLATLGEIKNLQQSIVNIDLQQTQFKNLVQSIEIASIQFAKLNPLSDITQGMSQNFATNLDYSINQISSILSIKMGISEIDIKSQAAALRVMSGALISDVIQKDSNVLSFKRQESVQPLPLTKHIRIETKIVSGIGQPSITIPMKISTKSMLPVPVLPISISAFTPTAVVNRIITNKAETNGNGVPSPIASPSSKPLPDRVHMITQSIKEIVTTQAGIVRTISQNITNNFQEYQKSSALAFQNLNKSTYEITQTLATRFDQSIKNISTIFGKASGSCLTGCGKCFNGASNPSGGSKTTDPKADAIRALGEEKFKDVMKQFGGDKKGEEELLKVLTPILERVSPNILKEAMQKTGNLEDAVKLINEKVRAELDNAKNIEKTEIVWGSNNKPQNIIAVKISEGVNKLKELFRMSGSNTIRPVPSVKLDDVTMNSVTTIEVSSEAESSLSGFKGSGKPRTRASPPPVPENR
jgi:hypothetical protein